MALTESNKTPSAQTEGFDGRSLGQSLLLAVLFLVGLGLVAVYASSSMKAAQDFADPFFFFKKQAVAAAIGFGIFWLIQYIPFKWIERATLPVLILTQLLI